MKLNRFFALHFFANDLYAELKNRRVFYDTILILKNALVIIKTPASLQKLCNIILQEFLFAFLNEVAL